MRARTLALVPLLAVGALLWLWQPWVSEVEGENSNVGDVEEERRAQLAGAGSKHDGEDGDAASVVSDDGEEARTLPLQVPYQGRIGLTCKAVYQDRDDVERPASAVEFRVGLWFPNEEKETLHAATTDEKGIARIGPFDLPRLPRHAASETFLICWAGGGAWSETELWLDEEWLNEDVLKKGSEDLDVAPAVFDDNGVAWLPVHTWHTRRVLVTGRVVTEQGEPYPFPTIDVLGHGDLEGDVDAWQADGSFTVALSGSGEVTLRVRHGGLDRRFFDRTIYVPETGLDDVEIEVPAPLSIEGTVALPDGTPLIETALILTRAQDDLLELAPKVQTNKLDENETWVRALSRGGTFSFRGLKTGSGYAIWWFDDAGTPHRLPQEYHAGDRDVRIVIDRHRFTVHLIDARTGARIQGEELYVRPADGADLRGALGNAAHLRMEGYDDSYWIANPGTKFRITAFARGYVPVDVTHTIRKASGTEVVHVPMEPTTGRTVLRVQVLDPAGRELPDVTPDISERIGDVVREAIVQLARNDGAWETRELAPGTVVIEPYGDFGNPSSPRARFALRTSVEVELPKRGTKEVALQLREGGAIRLNLGFPSGNLPANRFRFLLVGADDEVTFVRFMQHHASNDHWTVTNRAGTDLESHAVEPGRYTFRVVGDTVPAWTGGEFTPKPSPWQTLETPVTIVAGKVTTVDLTLVRRND